MKKTIPSFTLAIIIGITLLAYSVQTKQRQIQQTKNALILDTLPETQHNFTMKTLALLQEHDYKVDIIRNENVTVDYIRNLPSKYSLTIFRVHSGVFEEGVWLFTGEEFQNTRYVMEQLADEVHLGRVPYNDRLFFTVGSSFIKRYWDERFSNTLFVFLGCSTFESLDLVETLDYLGINVVGWDDSVTLHRTDEGMLVFLESLLEGASFEVSTKKGNKSGEGSLVDTASLRFYPEDLADTSIE